MFIKKVTIQNFRLFDNANLFELDDLNVPDGTSEGSGLSIFVGENGCGKTSILDALSLPLLSYKSDSFDLGDLNDINEKCLIQVFSNSDFDYKGTVPRTTYKGQGFLFEAGVRSRGNSSYLSSMMVTDQKFIRANGQTKPEDNKPDLRVSVNNPWSGPRFSENDVVYLDKNRTYQVRGGTYNSTRFDRLMEDLDYQYLKADDTPIDLSGIESQIADKVENTYLQQAITKFSEVSGIELNLCLVNKLTPHKKAFFSLLTSGQQQIQLDAIGSGYEMIFSLIYSFYLATQSGKNLILLIDEPELHLHPKIQREFIKLLLEFSKSAQIILTSHSPLLVKHLLEEDNVKTFVLNKESDQVVVNDVADRKLSFLSSNEINYIAFNLATEEYHNELYEELKASHGATENYKDFDNSFFVTNKHEAKDSPWRSQPNEVSKHTFIRNQIHHRAENGVVGYTELFDSIEILRSFF